MPDARDPNQTLDHSPADELDDGLAAAFGPPTTPGGFAQPPLLPDPDSGEGPVVQPTSVAVPGPETGRYQFLGELARGGMGVVLKARDPDLGRALAVKVLREELRGRPAVLRRFVEEAQVGGQLQHPGCVPVYELGNFADGRPYFTMKLVKGRTLAALLAERQSPAHERPRFLHIFEQVCQAVAYAHAKGVVHRDLKPANVMVGGFGEVQVMDWGLAKVLPRGGVADEERVSRERPEQGPTEIRTIRSGAAGPETEAGSVGGTPAFMPPEQAAGEVERVDERVDVFGLGAVLCVILTGEPPYTGRDQAEVRRKALRGDLGDCLARLGRCGADAELVGLAKRCLAVEPAGRPRHAGEVAAAVAAYRQEVEERARRAELERAAAVTRAVEECKRRKWQAAVAASGVLLVLGLGGGGWWLSLDRAQRRADELRAAAERDAAVAAALPVVAVARDAGRWLEARAALEQAEHRLGDGGPDELRHQVAQARADLGLAEALEDARLRGTDLRDGSFDTEGKLAAYEAAFAHYGLPAVQMPPEELAGRVRGSAVRDALVVALDDWAYRHPDTAVKARLRQAAGLADPDGWRGAVRRAVAEGDRAALERLAADPHANGQPAPSLHLLASALGSARGDPAAAELLRQARQAHPADFWVHHQLGWCLAEARPPRAEEAEAGYRAAVALRPQSPGARINLGIALARQGRLAEAEAAFRAALRLKPDYPDAHYNLGLALDKQGRYPEAEAAYREALRLQPDLPEAHCNLGTDLYRQGRFAEALVELRRGHELGSRRPGWPYPSAQWVRDCERLLALDRLLPAVLAGLDPPASARERLELADLCVRYKQLPATAARLAAAAFAADPKLANDLGASHRYNAACAATLAAAGRGDGAAAPAKLRASLSRQALAWLRADLVLWSKQTDDPKARPQVAQSLRHWQQDPDLAGVRDPAELAKLPPGERAEWEHFWKAVESVLGEAQSTH
jgi:Flp pilus assembly protein TadD/tRNA A-37 threonylcarbamoyl transferase component Bud32